VVNKNINFIFGYENYDLTITSPWTGFLLAFVPIILTYISLCFSKKLDSDPFEKGDIIEMEHASNSFLPSYLGYFFVALSISATETLWFVYIVLFVFTYKSQALYFNPLFLVFGYKFYNAKKKNGDTIFLISRENVKNSKDFSCQKAYRINDYTFISKDK
jgi:O-antigen ligase